MTLYQKLSEREHAGRPIRIGLVGAGQMGTGLVSQTTRMQGLLVAAIADINLGRARNALLAAGVPADQIVKADSAVAIDVALADGNRAITQRAELLPATAQLEAIVEATGIPNLGAKITWEAILGRKHVILLNVETDVMVGPLLKRLADAAGVIYSGAAGDEPAATFELYEFARTLGLTILCAGKGKNNPLDVAATPDDLEERARAVGASAKMLCSFVDGTKTQVEMAALANATGLHLACRGMHGPHGRLADLPNIFARTDQGGLVGDEPIVDYVIGDVAPGVFLVFTSDLPVVGDELRYLKMGDGPNWVLYRPYHLTSLETPLSVARAVLNHEATIAPASGMRAEVITVAKRALRAGERIDGIGGYTVYGLAEQVEIAQAEALLPLGLAQNAILRHNVPLGAALSYNDVILDETQTVVQLRRLQDQWLGIASRAAPSPANIV
ncbi:MAG: flagellar biosynthesis protein FlgA [Chloroflexales bacterium]|nr:flagellar biosynthesis protein FlgA [Chloroflexales bacterium]